MRRPFDQPEVERTRPTSGSWFALASLVLLGALFIGNNLAPYFWLPSSGPMIMFAGLSPDADNHFFMPKVPLGESGIYVMVLSVKGASIETPPGRILRRLGEYAERRSFFLSLNLIRYHASLACAASASPQLQVSLRRFDGGRLEYENICAEPAELSYVFLPGLRDCTRCDYFRDFHRKGESRQ